MNQPSPYHLRNQDRVHQRCCLMYLPLWLLLPVVAACAPQPPYVSLNDQHFSVEIADDVEEQTLGLMFREHMPADHGMLFVYNQAQAQSYWMKNCRIALDIMYFDSERRLINVHHSVPPCRNDPCPGYASEAPARYVLELNGGTAKRLGFQPGDELQLHL